MVIGMEMVVSCGDKMEMVVSCGDKMKMVVSCGDRDGDGGELW